MATEVDICNLALAHLGDAATVASIDPPEGSAQADHCARFYPIARDALLESHPWGFCTRREALALLTTEASGWAYCYAVPNLQVNVLAVLAPDAADDYSVAPLATWPQSPIVTGGAYTPQPFALETLADGTEVVYTDQQNAVLRFTVKITDTSKFSPLFVEALSWLLASHLAGPVLKGETGTAAAEKCFATYKRRLSDAIESDANQRRTQVYHNVPWLSGR